MVRTLKRWGKGKGWEEEAFVQVYSQFVEIGRVVFVVKGKSAGKVAAIVDVVDGNRVLIDGPVSGVPRQAANFKQLQLTKFTLPALRHGALLSSPPP